MIRDKDDSILKTNITIRISGPLNVGKVDENAIK